MDGVDRRAYSCSRSEAKQQRAPVIFREFKLDPGVDADHVDAGDLGRPSLVTDNESSLIKHVKPRVGSVHIAAGHEWPLEHGRVGPCDLTWVDEG